MTNPAQQHHFRVSGWALTACALVFALAILISRPASAQPTFNVIYHFTGGSDGFYPAAGLTIDARGNLYGTAAGGGRGDGTVYQLIHNASGWHFNRLYSFSGGDGGDPEARVFFGPGGALYGTTEGGGSGHGTVFSLMSPPDPPRTIQENHWIETVLYSFTGGSDADYPLGDLAFDQAGNIFGSTILGGSHGLGTVFKLTRSGNTWSESVLYSFTTFGNDGNWPNGVTIQAGDLYGTTEAGGSFGSGTVFQLTPAGSGWAENTLSTFQGSRGGSPESGVVFDGAGNMYGSTTGYDRVSYGPGTVWELMPSGGSWMFNTLYNFTTPPDCAQPAGPINAPLIMDRAGNLYGTTYADGAYCLGSVFKLSPSGGGQWTYTSLHDFTGGSDGGYPESNVIIDANGNLYGTASAGGTGGNGVVWEITP